MKPLRVALVVQNKCFPDEGGTHRAALLKEMCHAGEIDLVVCDEWFLMGPLADWRSKVEKLAMELRTPVLTGYGYEGETGFITAAYVNPRPAPGETGHHLYYKHSSAPELPYLQEGYLGRDDPMFEPIQLAGHKIGAVVCHDMFFGLLTARFMDHGATALFDLTGGNVQLKKWRTICRARSIELGGPFYCTMAVSRNKDQGGKSEAIAFQDGAEVAAISKHTRPDGTGGFDIYPLTPGPLPNGSTRVSQKLRPTEYNDLRLSLGGASDADVRVTSQGDGLRIEGTAPLGSNGSWQGFRLPVGDVGVLAVPLDQLNDPRVLYRLRPRAGAYRHHIVVYHSSGAPADEARTLAVLELRAIEHRIAACALAGAYKEVVKTDNYKHIQRIGPDGDTFGLNAKNLGGTHVTWKNAIPKELFRHYLELL